MSPDEVTLSPKVLQAVFSDLPERYESKYWEGCQACPGRAQTVLRQGRALSVPVDVLVDLSRSANILSDEVSGRMELLDASTGPRSRQSSPCIGSFQHMRS